jgi:ribose 5-phosphate isomerase A
MARTKTSNDTAKKSAGYAAANLIEEGMLVGLGTGSTTAFFLEALAKRCRDGLSIHAVATSQNSLQKAQIAGIPLLDSDAVDSLDLTVDGADELDPHKNMIKGGGGALLREKLVALASKEMVVIIDESKLVKQLGGAPLPVEIVRFACKTTIKRLEAIGYEGTIRFKESGDLFITDNGNYIFDIHIHSAINEPEKEHEKIKLIPGVVETGLFFHIAGRVVVGYQNGNVTILT